MCIEKTRVLVVDKYPVVRYGLARKLESVSDITVVGMAGSVAEAIKLTKQTQPKLVLTDMHLLDGTGAEICHQARNYESCKHVLILTAHDADSDLWEVLKARADGVIYKSTDISQVAWAVRAVAAGERLWTTEQVSRAKRWWDEVGSRLMTLTKREHDVLQLVAQGMSNKAIAAVLCIGITSVETHMTRLLDKLDLRARGELTAFAWRHKLVDDLQEYASA